VRLAGVRAGMCLGTAPPVGSGSGRTLVTLALPCSRFANLPICVCPVGGRSGLQTDSQACASRPHAGRPRAGKIAVVGTHRR
jgi:hypothetical protein